MIVSMKLPSFSTLLVAALSTNFPLSHAAPANARNGITPRQGLGDLLGGDLLGGDLLGGLLPGLGETQGTKVDAGDAPKASACHVMLYEESNWEGDYFRAEFYGGRCGTYLLPKFLKILEDEM